MSDENRQALLMVAAELRKIIRQRQSNEYQLRSMAEMIAHVVRTEKKDVLTSKQTKA